MKTILVNLYYRTTTPESAERDEYESQGFDKAEKPMTVHELAYLIREGKPSAKPCRGTTNESVVYQVDINYEMRSETVRSVHYNHKQTDPDAPILWRMAFEMAGLLSSQQKAVVRIYHRNVERFTCNSEHDAFMFLLREQPNSVYTAITEGEWKVEVKDEQGEYVWNEKYYGI